MSKREDKLAAAFVEMIADIPSHFSLPKVCMMVSRNPGDVLLMVKRLGIKPSMAIDCVVYFASTDVDRIIEIVNRENAEKMKAAN